MTAPDGEKGLLNLARQNLAYTLWADRQHMKALAYVAEEHRLLETGTSHGSLLGTMAHVLGAEQVWLSRFLGDPLPTVPGVAEYPDLDTLEWGFQEHGASLEFFLASLSSEQLLTDVAWQNTRGESFERPLWEPLMHMVQHSGYHRGQMTTMLRQLGYEPPVTDLIGYLTSR
ncbi:MAG: DUF664 domain-containing protein [Thermoanaerobaculia bacterium]|nr:DUF664 domain-containing protein [Thermoanaerobaculia bacterium]